MSFAPKSRLRRVLGVRRLNVDIVDYPGEWLLDLAMLGESYAAWSAEALRLAREPARKRLAKELGWTFVAALDPLAAEDEQTALEGAGLFTRIPRGSALRRADGDDRARPLPHAGRSRRLAAADVLSARRRSGRAAAARLARAP